ncbi:HTH-type transcriptional activator RhaR [Pseudomonas fluorescens]|uniref:HTH-type transcriptional activator RhaR n=1 Tax=Pseudomonas fluorescens TaxID=294 RepID=A0A8H2RRT0_PSEFL|nr:helix-turn-helix domain-containing protein [Pseudomonas fluorescens]VVO59149.1 HTH-type transcriptional activator RhaR [Pseudomonas fluorescens]
MDNQLEGGLKGWRASTVDLGSRRVPVTNWSCENIDVATQSGSVFERVDYWREMILRLFADVEIGAVANPAFFGKVRSQKCELLRISDVSAAAQAVNRRHMQPRSRDEDKYFAVLMLDGTEQLEQDGNRAIISPGDFAIYDATRPHKLNFANDWRQIIVSLPRSSLNQLVVGMESRMATRVSMDNPVGRVMRMFLESVTSQISQFSAAEMVKLSESATNLIALTLGNLQALDPEHSRSQALTLMRVKVFVNDNLHDPTLNAQFVSRGTGLSARYINKLFEHEASSLMRYLLRRRLERCSTDLLNPANATLRISDIAFRWGFNDLSHFSRVFRGVYGQAPRDWREAQLRQ